MTAKEIILNHPQTENESNEAYFRRMADISGRPKGSFKKAYYQLRRKMVTTQQRLDRNGNITSSVQKLQSEKLLLPPEHLELSRLSTNKTTGQQWEIYTKESQNKALFELNKETIKETIYSLNLSPIITNKIEPNPKALKINITDVHVGMSIKNDLYDSGKWGEKELFDTLDTILKYIYSIYDNHELIVVQDLGDFVDGYNAETTRGGHKLSQNMTNVEAFKFGSKFKLDFAIALYMLGCKVKFYNLTNCNHGGDFSTIVNLNAKTALEYLAPEIEYNIVEDFISHYFIDNHCFIITHGKDKEFMKFGFKPSLDDKAKDHIQNYIDKNNLHNYILHFEKGNDHQEIRDATNPKFTYNSHPSLSPSSEWVTTNFAKGRRGFSVEEIKGDLKTYTPIYL